MMTRLYQPKIEDESSVEQELRFVSALLMASIWNPTVWTLDGDSRHKRRMMLLYRTRGIVNYDRELNGETVE